MVVFTVPVVHLIEYVVLFTCIINLGSISNSSANKNIFYFCIHTITVSVAGLLNLPLKLGSRFAERWALDAKYDKA